MLQIYRSYHSEFKIRYAEGKLPDNLKNEIPRSTRQRWKQKNSYSFWLPYPIHREITELNKIDSVETENGKLKKQLKTLFYILSLYKEIYKSVSIKPAEALRLRKTIDALLQTPDDCLATKTLWRYLPFSEKQWKVWNSRLNCTKSLQGLCRKKHPQQLSLSEQEFITTTANKKEYQYWPLSSIYYQLLKTQKIHCCKSTFYRHCRLLGVTRKGVKRSKQYKPLTSIGPLKILHQDITLFRTVNGVRHYLYVIRDNFSRAILACKASTAYKSQIARETLETVLLKFGLMKTDGVLITDDGMENKGALEHFLKKPGMLWKKLIAQIDIIQSNSMVEAANKILKYRFLYTRPIADTEDLITMLEQAVESYNNMPNAQLFGFTPNEVLAGSIPDRFYFKQQIEKGRLLRIAANQKIECNIVCQT